MIATANGSNTVKYRLTIRQVFNAEADNTSSTFTYMVMPMDQATKTLTDIGTNGNKMTLNGDISDYVDIALTIPGVYTYNVYQEVHPVKDGYDYDYQVYTVTLRASMVNGEPTVIAVIMTDQDTENKQPEIVFTNSYTPKKTITEKMADPPVRKTVTGEPPVNGVFTFKLTARETTYPMPAGSSNGVKTVNIIGSGVAEFGTWSYVAPGTYFYTVSEMNKGESGYTYDSTVYTITDTVKEQNGALMLSRVVTNPSNVRVSTLTFINNYTAPSGPVPPGPSDPTSPTGPSNPGAGPKTGDDSNATFYLILLSLGAALMGGALVFLIKGAKKKKKRTV
jgi:pilin isopeptide linkage protein